MGGLISGHYFPRPGVLGRCACVCVFIFDVVIACIYCSIRSTPTLIGWNLVGGDGDGRYDVCCTCILYVVAEYHSHDPIKCQYDAHTHHLGIHTSNPLQ